MGTINTIFAYIVLYELSRCLIGKFTRPIVKKSVPSHHWIAFHRQHTHYPASLSESSQSKIHKFVFVSYKRVTTKPLGWIFVRVHEWRIKKTQSSVQPLNTCKQSHQMVSYSLDVLRYFSFIEWLDEVTDVLPVPDNRKNDDEVVVLVLLFNSALCFFYPEELTDFRTLDWRWSVSEWSHCVGTSWYQVQGWCDSKALNESSKMSIRLMG